MCRLVVPPLLGYIVEHFAEDAPRHGAREAEAAAGATAVCVFLQAFLLPHGFLVAQAAGVRARARLRDSPLPQGEPFSLFLYYVRQKLTRISSVILFCDIVLEKFDLVV